MLSSTVSFSVSTTTSALLGRLVGVGDAGEVLDLAAQRLLVEALDVAAGQLFDAALRVDLDEVADEGAVLVADLARRARSRP